MKPSEQERFEHLYQRHLRALKLQGFSQSTIDAYARAVRRIAAHYHCSPDLLSVAQLEAYFAQLVDSHSWSTVKIDRERGQVHIRRGKGHRDRFVPLPDLTYQALRALWAKHHHPRLLFPNPTGSPARIRAATRPMGIGSAQAAMKAVVVQCGIKKKSRSTPCAMPLPPICWNRV